MRITFLGAAHEVTGSCTYIECGATRFIVDCGMEQGRDMFENQSLPISPSQVDFALLTHAHIDHSGLLPLLAKNGGYADKGAGPREQKLVICLSGVGSGAAD